MNSVTGQSRHTVIQIFDWHSGLTSPLFRLYQWEIFQHKSKPRDTRIRQERQLLKDFGIDCLLLIEPHYHRVTSDYVEANSMKCGWTSSQRCDFTCHHFNARGSSRGHLRLSPAPMDWQIWESHSGLFLRIAISLLFRWLRWCQRVYYFVVVEYKIDLWAVWFNNQVTDDGWTWIFKFYFIELVNKLLTPG
jgi:hypothetical protein